MSHRWYMYFECDLPGVSVVISTAVIQFFIGYKTLERLFCLVIYSSLSIKWGHYCYICIRIILSMERDNTCKIYNPMPPPSPPKWLKNYGRVEKKLAYQSSNHALLFYVHLYHAPKFDSLGKKINVNVFQFFLSSIYFSLGF